MTESPTLIGPQLLTPDNVQAIEELLRQGRRISEVIAHGLSRRPGWRRAHVVQIVSDNGWSLDSDGRIPRRFRTSKEIPMTALPGAPMPEPPREPVVEFPDRGTVTEGPRATTGPAVNAMIHRWVADARTHDTAAVRRAAEKAQKALEDLHQLLVADSQQAKLRARLAELEREADRIRRQLGAKRKRTPAKPAAAVAPRGQERPTTPGTPIKHGTWGGYQQETRRGLDHCADCIAAKDTQVAKMRAHLGQPKTGPVGA